jgi:GNAT superfamily N-acetyltransferase
MGLAVRPLTPETWDDFVTVMGRNGGDAGCWCLYNKQTSREFTASKGDQNRATMKALVDSGEIPGLIGYLDGEPIGWVAVQPRDVYGRLGRSRVAKPLDERPAWAVTCFVIPKSRRGTGVATALLEAATRYAAEQGARLLEGYPVEPRQDRMPDFWAWMGFPSMFNRAGFEEVARRTETRPFMRKEL